MKRDKVMAEVDAAEARRRAIQALYASLGFFERTSKEELARLEEEERTLGARIDAWMKEWEDIELEIGALEG